MKNFSLSWFKSQRQKEFENLKVEEQRIKNKILEKQLSEPSQQKDESKVVTKPYKSIRLINDVLTVVLNDDNIVSKTAFTNEQFNELRTATTEKELLVLLGKKEIEEFLDQEQEQMQNLKVAENVDILTDSGEFTIEDNAVYMKGIHRSVPSLLAAKFVDVLINEGMHDEYQSLKKFWMKCCLNPNAQSAEDLYTFLSHHQFKIDKHGNFYAYRRVVSIQSDNKELVDFVSNTYNKVKAVWKKAPKNYCVGGRLNEYHLFKNGEEPKDDNPYWKNMGNLEQLYLELPSMAENRYTDSHTHSEDYRVGRSVSMPRNEGDDNNQISCSMGFHAASKKYDYRGFGDVPILVIINPMDVLAVPLNEVGKLRTCRWFFAMTLPEDEKYILDDEEFDVTELGDKFEEECLKDMEGHIKKSFAEEIKRHTFNLPNLSHKDINNIVEQLNKMKEVISKRVVSVK